MLIEQAIFTSADTDRAGGYQIVSQSAGLSEADARELAVWGPSHDSLLDRPGQPPSTNFHRLSSGAYCISRTTLEGVEYSGRGGSRVYTHFLIVSRELLARFANNPFAVLRAAMAGGAMTAYREIPAELPALRLGGRAPAVDVELLARLTRDPGPAALASLVQAALSSDRLAIASRVSAEQLLAGLISLLPIECRTELTFASGLKHSPTRGVRLLTLSSSRTQWRNVARNGITLIDLDAVAGADNLQWQGWAGCVADALGRGKLSLLAAELERPRPGLRMSNLDELCRTLRGKLNPTEARPATASRPAAQADADDHDAFDPRPVEPAQIRRQRMAAAQESSTAVAASTSATLSQQSPEVLELLERIDDVVFAAIDGNERALAELEVLWPLAAQDLDSELFEQSREQYLRCALSICSECADGQVKRPERAIAAVEVLCILFDD